MARPHRSRPTRNPTLIWVGVSVIGFALTTHLLYSIYDALGAMFTTAGRGDSDVATITALVIASGAILAAVGFLSSREPEESEAQIDAQSDSTDRHKAA